MGIFQSAYGGTNILLITKKMVRPSKLPINNQSTGDVFICHKICHMDNNN
jgi:hypothetical protein